MFLLKQILPAAIVAMMAAAGICSFALFREREGASRVLTPLALGIAYLIGHLFIVGRVSFPPADTTNWLPYFAVIAAVMGAFCAVLALKPWTRLLIFALVSVGALRLLLKPKIQYGWSSGQAWIWVLLLASALVLLAMILDLLVNRSAMAGEFQVFSLIVSGGIFGVMMLSGSVLLGQFAAVLGAAVFGSLVLVVRKISVSRGVVPVLSLLTGTLLMSGYFFAELPATSAILLAFAPVLATIPIRSTRQYWAFGIRAALVSIPVVLALVLAFLSSPPLDY